MQSAEMRFKEPDLSLVEGELLTHRSSFPVSLKVEVKSLKEVGTNLSMVRLS